MPQYALSYLLLSQSFVIYVDLFVVVALWLIYHSNKKRYLALAIAAGIVEASRQIPGMLINFYPESAPLYQVSILLEFTATLLFLSALLQLTATHMRQVVLLVPIVIFVITGAILIVRGLPAAGLEWYLYFAPLILLTFMVMWVAVNAGTGWTPSRFLLTGTSFTLLVLRTWMAGLEFGDIFYLLIYLEYLVFPMMLAALILSEAELSNQNAKVLLEQRTQAVEDLQFIVDNSDDVILIADEVGLVRTWSTKAETKFGYSFEQAISKLHMDGLFVQNHIGNISNGISADHATSLSPSISTTKFETKMEAMDGRWFKMEVSMKTVAHRGDVYNIYVLKEVTTKA